ncbi:MAG TPA: hypothetical protein VGK74_03705 [Symbiobacteriaceae bacterium]|jgi:hypothetical protein
MSQFDVAIGLGKETLDKGTGELFTKPAAREKLFKGSQGGDMEGLAYTVSWEIQAAPTFTLTAPSADVWAQSINSKGENPAPGDMPTANVFQVVFAQFHGEYRLGDTDPVSGTGQVIAIVTLEVANNKATITPKSVWVDQSSMQDWDKAILDGIVLPQVLGQATTMLAGFTVPDLSRTQDGVTIDLTPPQVAIADQKLIIAASMKSKGSVDIAGVQWPAQPLFLLLSPYLLQNVATQVSAKLVGYEKTGDGSYPDDGAFKGALTYDWKVKLNSADAIAMDATDKTKLSANVGFGFEAVVKPLGVGGPCAVTAATNSL